MEGSARQITNFLLLICIFWGCNYSVLFGAAPSGFATVDTRLLLLLHPLMANYDYSNGKFYRSENPNKDFSQVVKELQEAKEKGRKTISTLESEQKRLLSARTDLIMRREEALADLTAKAASAGYQIKGKEDRLKEYRERYDKQIAQINAQIAQNAMAITKAQEDALSSIYLTSEEAEKRVAQAKAEIQALIAEAARESGITLVIDNTYAMRSQELSDDIPQPPVIDEAVDVVSASLFHAFANLTIDPALKQALITSDGRKIPEEHLVVGRSIGMSDNLQRYLQFRNYLPEAIGNFSPGQIFLVGGTDLTPWVAHKLFAKYQIPETIKNSFMVLIRNYSAFEKAAAEAYLKGR